ncbi:hypothetical protein BLAT2472_40183 [Burkholderia latens]
MAKRVGGGIPPSRLAGVAHSVFAVRLRARERFQIRIH